MQPILLALIGSLAASIGGLVTWLVARRSKSGRVDTTEAETLWTESKAMREELRNEVQSLREQAAKDRAAAAEQIESVKAHAAEVAAQLQAQLQEALSQNEHLRYEVQELRAICGATNTDIGAIRREMSAVRSVSQRAAATKAPAKKAPAKKTTPKGRGR